jgi:Fe-S-cluster-containing dehydrogenase component
MGWIPIWSKACILCAGRVKNGKEPYCVYNCPTEALVFGREKVESEIARLREAGCRLFDLPDWEGTKKGITYASKK